MEGKYFYRELRLGNRKLVPCYLFKMHHRCFKTVTVNRQQGSSYFVVGKEYNFVNLEGAYSNREPGTSSLFLILYLNAGASKVHIGNEYCQINVEEAYIYWRLRIGNRESGTGNEFLVPYFGKNNLCFKSANRE